MREAKRNAAAMVAYKGRGALLAAAVAATASLLYGQRAEGAITHRYSFNDNTADDSVGGAHGSLINGASVFDGQLVLGNSGTSNDVNSGQYVDLPNNIAKTSSFTIEGWATWTTRSDWQRFFDFGTNTKGEQQPGDGVAGYDGTSYFFVTPRTGNDAGQGRLNNFNGEVRVNPDSNFVNGRDAGNAAFDFGLNTEHMFALTRDAATNTLSLYYDGALVSQNTNATLDPAQIDMVNVWLGRSNWQGDPFFAGSINEFRIFDNALTTTQIGQHFNFGPNALEPSGTNTWQTNGSGNWASVGGWSQGHIPTPTEQAVIPNGAVVTVNTDVGANQITQITNGTLTFASGASMTATVDLAPGNGPGSSTLNLNGGTLTGRITIDGNTPGGTGTKAVNFNGGTLVVTAGFNLAGTNLTTSVGAGGATIEVPTGATVNWAPVLTAAPGATLNKQGPGTMNLTGGGFLGRVNLRAGTLGVAGSVGAAGQPLQLGDANFPGGDVATLSITGAGSVLSPVTVGAPGTGGTYTINVGTNATVAIPNPITMNTSLTIASVATTGTNALNISGGITSTQFGNTLTFNNAGRVNVTTAGIGDGTGSLAVVKNGGGTVQFSAANSYTGGTTINAGGIIFDAPNTMSGTGQNVTIAQNGFAAAGTGFDYANLTGTFMNRIDPNAAGTVALAANSAENFDFSGSGLNFSNLSLGAVTNVTYTGTLTPSPGLYRVGGGGGNLTFANANAITGGNLLVVGGGGGGTVTLAQPNDYTGETIILGGATLAVANGDRLSNATINLDGGTLNVIGTTPATFAQPILGTGQASRIHVNNSAGATFSGGVTGAGGRITKAGTGTATFTAPLTGNNSPVFFDEGTTVFTDGGSVQTTAWMSIGGGNGNNGTVIFQGNSTANVPVDFNVSDVGNSIGKMIVRDNATITTRTLYVGKNGTSEGSTLQSGGTVTNAATVGDWRIGGGGGAGDQNAVGSYTMTGGTLGTNANLQIGANGRGVMTIQGGSAASSGFPSVGRFATSYGVLTVSGTGVFNHTGPNNAMLVGESGLGHLNILEGGTVNATGTALRVGQNADGRGFVNLGTGGTLNAGMIAGGLGASTVNFNGGTFKSTGSNAASITGIKNVYVNAGGGTIDTTLGDVTVSSPISTPTGQGLGSVALTTGGTSYVSHPLVEVSGGGGTGASAIALLNASGQVTGIQVTNPGVGYTSAPTVVLKGGGSTAPATLGTVTLADNTAGTLTKTGTGTLTIGSVGNTFSGPTVVNQGTLRLSAAAQQATALWNANSVAGNAGDPVATWTDTVGGKSAVQNGVNPVPTLALNAIGTNKALRFTGGAGTNGVSLALEAVDSPISNATDFSIAVVFKPNASGVGQQGSWWQNTGIVDAEQPGATNDWGGLVINANNRIGAGIGNPDATVYTPTGVATGTAHVAVMTRSGNGPFTLTVDGQTVGAIGATTPRGAFRVLFGGIQTNANFFNGDIAEIQMYNTVLNPYQVNALGASLSSTYGLANTFGPTSILPNSPITVNNGGTLDVGSRQAVKSLTVNGGGNAVVSAGVLTVGDNSLALPLNLGAGNAGKVDVMGNGLVVDAAPGTEAATLVAVRTAIVKGFNAGDWGGTGITSSTAAANASSRGVGYALGSEVATGGQFMGSPADASSVVARFTLLGDATLDGNVDFNDLVKLAQNYNIVDGSRVWFSGDFTYDGNTDFNDLVKLAQNYNTSLPTEPIPGAPANFGADLAAAFAAVPEPGALSLLGIAGAALAGRRRRRS